MVKYLQTALARMAASPLILPCSGASPARAVVPALSARLRWRVLAVPLRAGRTEELKWEERLAREREAWERAEEKPRVVLSSIRADSYKHETVMGHISSYIQSLSGAKIEYPVPYLEYPRIAMPNQHHFF